MKGGLAVFIINCICNTLQALRAREEINTLLAQPIPSATEIVDEAEKIIGALHQDFLQDATPHARPSAPSNLIHLMTNITQQLEECQPGSDVGPALHAARQVTYWSSPWCQAVLPPSLLLT